MDSGAVGTAQAKTVSGAGPGAVDASSYLSAAFRRRSQPQVAATLGPAVTAAVSAFQRVLSTRKSEVLLMWPQHLTGIALLHALAALELLHECDEKTLATLLFPWNRNSAGWQRQLLVDREAIYQATLAPLNRIGSNARHPANGYVMALHSLNHILASGRKNTRLMEALKSDPGLEHPTLFEIMPQHGVQAQGLYPYNDQFLRRLQKYTWIGKRQSYVDAAVNPGQTPFFLFGVDTDAVNADALRRAGVDPGTGGRRPDIVLVDATQRARSRQNHEWQEPLRRFLDILLELYLDECPPVLAITDDVFSFSVLEHDIIKMFEKWRSPDVQHVAKLGASVELMAHSDPLESEPVTEPARVELIPEVYGTDLLRAVEAGLKLRRALKDEGATEIADKVAAATMAVQNVLGLPGQPRQFYDFLTASFEGYERQRRGARFDLQTPRSQLSADLKAGLAGREHGQLEDFVKEIDALRAIADAENPGRRRFDECTSQLVKLPERSIIVLPNALQLAFVEWRFENDDGLSAQRACRDEKLILIDQRGLWDELDRAAQAKSSIERIVFSEPRADDLLDALTRPGLPNRVLVLANMARIAQVLRRLEILLKIDGIGPIANQLQRVEATLGAALGGHTNDIGDLDTELMPSRLSTLDLTAMGSAESGALRLITLTDGVRIRAFEGSEFALYEPDALQHFSRKVAKDLGPGDQICVFSPEFVSLARERLKFSANAPDVLKLYHQAVAEAAMRLPGWDWTERTDSLRRRMLTIDRRLDLPSGAAMRHWIDVDDLIKAPRDAVRPQAPRDRRHYGVFMRALNISDDVARYYWDFGVSWTRSARIKSGAFFHHVFMGVLIDPYGVASRLPENSRSEIWRIQELAENHVETVVANELGGAR